MQEAYASGDGLRVGQPATFAVVLRSRVGIVYVCGDVDIAAQESFGDALLRAWDGRPLPIIVSLQGCAYMDCAGLSALVRSANHTRVAIIVVVGKVSLVGRLLSMTGLDARFPVVESVQAAIAELTAPSVTGSRE